MAELITEEPYVPKLDFATVDRKRGYTGRTVVSFDRRVTKAEIRDTIAAFDGGSEFIERSRIFPDFGIAIVPIEFREEKFHAFNGGRGVTFEPERLYYIPNPIDVGKVTVSKKVPSPLEAMKVTSFTIKGEGVPIALLDTGIRGDHPDFERRRIRQKRFVPDVPDHDTFGHGTHCAGLAAGPETPKNGVGRYGVATEAWLLIAKVVTAEGWAFDEVLLEAMRWAVCRGAVVINLSLGRPVRKGRPHSNHFEQTAAKILEDDKVLIIAGAGNDREGIGDPVFRQANCPSILAVAGLNENYEPWDRSAVGENGDGGEINIAAPAVELLSADLSGALHGRLSGTSMAAAYASGVAALYALSGFRGRDLWNEIVRRATRDSLSDQQDALSDPKLVGAGLIQAP